MPDTVERQFKYLIERARRERDPKRAAELERGLLAYQTKPKDKEDKTK